MPEQVTASTAVSNVQHGDEVVVDTSRPTATLQALQERDELNDIVVTAFGFPYADSSALRSLAARDGIRIRLSMVPGDFRDVVSDGTVSYVPRTVYQAARSPALDADRRTVGIVQTSPLTDGDVHELGCLSTLGEELLGTAELSIVETNPRLPHGLDSDTASVSDIDYIVESQAPPPRLPSKTVDNAEQIASNILPLVPQKATIQLGVGSVMGAVGKRLADDRRVSLWSGLLGESCRPLIESDQCNSITACVAIGHDTSFYQWISEADKINFVSGSVSHDPAQLAAQSRFVAINSALQIDLQGQINAETIQGQHVGGVGGQSTFMTAASNDPAGVAIVAMTARTASGTPKLVARLPQAEVVTTPRYAVDYVVTEYGAARLSGCSVEQRARHLVSIAHPEDRPKLENAARNRGLIR